MTENNNDSAALFRLVDQLNALNTTAMRATPDLFQIETLTDDLERDMRIDPAAHASEMSWRIGDMRFAWDTLQRVNLSAEQRIFWRDSFYRARDRVNRTLRRIQRDAAVVRDRAREYSLVLAETKAQYHAIAPDGALPQDWDGVLTAFHAQWARDRVIRWRWRLWHVVRVSELIESELPRMQSEVGELVRKYAPRRVRAAVRTVVVQDEDDPVTAVRALFE